VRVSGQAGLTSPDSCTGLCERVDWSLARLGGGRGTALALGPTGFAAGNGSAGLPPGAVAETAGVPPAALTPRRPGRTLEGTMKPRPRDRLPESVTDAILESISDGVFTVDHAWRITSFNRAAEEITGVSEKLPFEEIIVVVVEYRGGMMID